MSLTVCASSTGELLSTLDAFKDLIGQSNSTGDELLTALLKRASAAVEGYVGYPLRAQTYSETVAGYGGRCLTVARTPIRQVLRVFDATSTDEGTEITSTEYTVDDADAGLLARDQGWLWTGVATWGQAEYRMPGYETRTYLVEYAAGYVAPPGTCSTAFGTTSTGRDLPYDVEQAVLETARGLWLARKRDPAVGSKSVGDLSITYRSERDDPSAAALIPPTAKALLAPYRRIGW